MFDGLHEFVGERLRARASPALLVSRQQGSLLLRPGRGVGSAEILYAMTLRLGELSCELARDARYFTPASPCVHPKRFDRGTLSPSRERAAICAASPVIHHGGVVLGLGAGAVLHAPQMAVDERGSEGRHR